MNDLEPDGTSRSIRQLPHWRQSRWFNLFVLTTLLISIGLMVFVLFFREGGPETGSEGRAGERIATFAVLDVGQALSAVLVTETGESLVYDFGLTAADAEEVIVPFLEDRNVDEIDYAILSHPHQDHVGGLPELLDKTSVSMFIDPALETTNQTYAESLALIEDHGIPVETARQGDTYTMGERVELEILWPTNDLILEPDGSHHLNENSTVVRADVEDVSILLTGDIEQEPEDTLTETNADDLDIDILQVGHHGSNTSSQDHFLRAAEPSLAVIPVGLNNQYGHPHAEVMQRLRQHETEIYRTDVDGTVIIDIDGESWGVTTDADTR